MLQASDPDLGPDGVGKLVSLEIPDGPVEVGDVAEELGVLVDDLAVLLDMLLLDCSGRSALGTLARERNSQLSKVSSKLFMLALLGSVDELLVAAMAPSAIVVPPFRRPRFETVLPRSEHSFPPFATPRRL